MHELITVVVDDASFFEIGEKWGRSIITGLHIWMASRSRYSPKIPRFTGARGPPTHAENLFDFLISHRPFI
jgi:hypothetical protein